MIRWLRTAFIATMAMATTAGAQPPAATELPTFSIGAVADCQYADEPDTPPRLYSLTRGKLVAAIDDFNRQRLSFVVHLGDFIDRDWATYNTMLPITGKLRHPLHFVLGNHEFAVDDEHKRQVPARLGMPARYYSFVRHGWMFIVTDGNALSSYAWPQGSPELARSMAAHSALYSDKPLWDGGSDDAQLRWIDAQLASADRRKLKVMLLSHFPLYPENPHNLWNAPAVMSVLDHHPSAKIWLDGHNHEGNYGERNGIHYVNLKSMLDTPETAYATIDFFPDRVVIHGHGREQDRILPLR